MHFEAEGNINASASTVWSIITDAAAYPNFDPVNIRIEGTIAEGEKVTAYTTFSPDRAFPATVSTFTPNKYMEWTGGMPLGLFKGVRSFRLDEKTDGSVDFTLREEFSGPLLFMMKSQLPDMTEAFQGFVAGLKARAEAM